MKQKPDETPDEWVRQMLNRLPDAPPPGSSFDSARLWNQLRPELQAKPARRQAWWWAAAACLAALVGGWLVWTQVGIEQKTAVVDRPQIDTLAKAKTAIVDKVVELAPVVAGMHRPKRLHHTTPGQRLPQIDNVVTMPEPPELAPIAQVTDPPATSIVASVPTFRKTNVAAVVPKRRFRVMHENELRAEDEAAPKIYPTNHFVRLGSGRNETQHNEEQRSNNTPDNSPPTLVMPLKTH